MYNGKKYELNREHDRLRSAIYRMQMTEEERKRSNRLAVIRQRRYRARIAGRKKPLKSNRAVGKKQLTYTSSELEKMASVREKAREQKRRQRQKLTDAQKTEINKTRRYAYHFKKRTNPLINMQKMTSKMELTLPTTTAPLPPFMTAPSTTTVSSLPTTTVPSLPTTTVPSLPTTTAPSLPTTTAPSPQTFTATPPITAVTPPSIVIAPTATTPTTAAIPQTTTSPITAVSQTTTSPITATSQTTASPSHIAATSQTFTAVLSPATTVIPTATAPSPQTALTLTDSEKVNISKDYEQQKNNKRNQSSSNLTPANTQQQLNTNCTQKYEWNHEYDRLHSVIYRLQMRAEDRNNNNNLAAIIEGRRRARTGGGMEAVDKEQPIYPCTSELEMTASVRQRARELKQEQLRQQLMNTKKSAINKRRRDAYQLKPRTTPPLTSMEVQTACQMATLVNTTTAPSTVVQTASQMATLVNTTTASPTIQKMKVEQQPKITKKAHKEQNVNKGNQGKANTKPVSKHHQVRIFNINTYELNREHDRLRSAIYRMQMTGEDRKRSNRLAVIRQRRYRARIAGRKKPQKSELEKMTSVREKAREQKRRQRQKLTDAQKTEINKMRRYAYHLKKSTNPANSQPTTTVAPPLTIAIPPLITSVTSRPATTAIPSPTINVTSPITTVSPPLTTSTTSPPATSAIPSPTIIVTSPTTTVTQQHSRSTLLLKCSSRSPREKRLSKIRRFLPEDRDEFIELLQDLWSIIPPKKYEQNVNHVTNIS